MKIRHCSITTLSPEEKKQIRDKLSHKNGLFYPLVKKRQSGVKLALIYERKKLVGWTAILPYCSEPYPQYEMMSFVDPDYRRRGFSKKSSRAILDHNGLGDKKVQVWTERMRRVVRKTGHKKVVR